MAEWTEDERRRAQELYEKGRADRAAEKAAIKVGDHVDTPLGTAWCAEEKAGGFLVNFDKDLPEPNPGRYINRGSKENAIYMELRLMRKLPS